MLLLERYSQTRGGRSGAASKKPLRGYEAGDPQPIGPGCGGARFSEFIAKSSSLMLLDLPILLPSTLGAYGTLLLTAAYHLWRRTCQFVNMYNVD